MAYKEVLRVEIQEVIRRWQARGSQRQIAEGTGLSRATVRKYLAAATGEGVVRDGPFPSEEQLSRLAGISRAGPKRVETPVEDGLAPWADQIYQWLTGDRLKVTRVQELLAARGCEVSSTSLRRFIGKRNWGRRSVRTVRMADTEPGEVAEADFGRLGMITDPTTGKRRVVWALIIVLSYSRHRFVWPTHSQKLDDVIAGLEAAWAFFGGVPRYLVIDNFPAAVAGPDPLHPRLTRGFLEYSQHRGFVADPARARHPKDKPKVERSVLYVRERLFKGGDFICMSSSSTGTGLPASSSPATEPWTNGSVSLTIPSSATARSTAWPTPAIRSSSKAPATGNDYRHTALYSATKEVIDQETTN